jgi:hypothetical protein
MSPFSLLGSTAPETCIRRPCYLGRTAVRMSFFAGLSSPSSPACFSGGGSLGLKIPSKHQLRENSVARPIRDLTGERFERWLVLRFDHSVRSARGLLVTYWLCRCHCGAVAIVMGKNLIDKHSRSCGCLQRDVAVAMAANLTGRRFGQWTVLRLDRTVKKSRNSRYWLCRCDCGAEKPVFGPTLTSGRSKSCGCNREAAIAATTTHGATSTKEWNAWRGMKTRCYNANNAAFDRYGGRADRPIKVCDRWLKSFENFLTDMGPAPSPKHSIERKNNRGHYTPSNCCWALPAEQSRNRRNTIMLTHDGRNMWVQDWAKHLGIGHTTLRRRLKAGWSVHDTLTLPDCTKNPRRQHLLTFRGKTLCIEDWAKHIGIKATTLHERLKRGWSVHKTLITGRCDAGPVRNLLGG